MQIKDWQSFTVSCNQEHSLPYWNFYPENRVIRFGYDLFFTHVLPFVGRVFSHDKSAYTYLNRSVKEFMWGEEMVSHIQNAGFKNVRFQPLTFGITTVYTATK